MAKIRTYVNYKCIQWYLEYGPDNGKVYGVNTDHPNAPGYDNWKRLMEYAKMWNGGYGGLTFAQFVDGLNGD
jgi:hypothetical protein